MNLVMRFSFTKKVNIFEKHFNTYDMAEKYKN